MAYPVLFSLKRPFIKMIDRGKISLAILRAQNHFSVVFKELVKLFETLRQHHCTLISLKENIDFSTTTGRMLANILASFAVFDNETRTERILAGQVAAKAAAALKKVRCIKSLHSKSKR
jgi:DNA invertase Pin-like site-specific DNA recombinase